MKKLIVFIGILTIGLFVSIKVSAAMPVSSYAPVTYSTGTGYQIDTSSRNETLYSIWRIFQNEQAVSNDAFRFYQLYLMLSLSSNPTQSEITSCVNQCKIRYSLHNYTIVTTNYRFNDLVMSKNYDYIDTSTLEDANHSYYMNETAFDENQEYILFRMTAFESFRGFIPMASSTSKQISSQESSTLNSNLAAPIVPNIVIPFPWNSFETTYSYHGFTRQFTGDQTVYGYGYGANSVSDTIDYSYLLISNIDFKLIDNDKILLTYGTNDYVCLTKDQHYRRQLYNITYADIDTAYANGFRSKAGAYFHKLGLTDGDESNLDNVKYKKNSIGTVNSLWPNSSYECIFDGDGNLDTNALVLGTFNYYDSADSKHYAHDVIPYFIWGNTSSDTSTWLERLAWDHDSVNATIFSDWRIMRGQNLYDHYLNSIYAHTIDSDERAIIANVYGDPTN